MADQTQPPTGLSLSPSAELPAEVRTRVFRKVLRSDSRLLVERAAQTTERQSDIAEDAHPATEPAAEQKNLVAELPSEVRMRIYKEVLRSDFPLLIANKKYPNEVRFDVSLLTVSKATYVEASDAFFEVNYIRFWLRRELDSAVKDDVRCIRFVRHLELVNITDASQWLSEDFPSIIRTCLSFPKLKSLTIAYDASDWSPELPDAFSRWEELGVTGAQCVDVGVYQLEFVNSSHGLESQQHRLLLKHCAIADAWHEIRTTPRDQSLLHLCSYTKHIFPRKLPLQINTTLSEREYLMAQIDLSTFCGLYDLWRRAKREVTYDFIDDEDWVPNLRALSDDRRVRVDYIASILQIFERYTRSVLQGYEEWAPHGWAPRGWALHGWAIEHAGLSVDVRVKDLDLAEHGRELLHWWTELLVRQRRGWPTERW